MDDINFLKADILKVLANVTRLKIIDLLKNGERCVCEIFPAIGKEQSNTSRHLNIMLSCGVLSRRKEGLKIYYSIKNPEILEVVEIIGEVARREIALKHKLFEGV